MEQHTVYEMDMVEYEDNHVQLGDLEDAQNGAKYHGGRQESRHSITSATTDPIMNKTLTDVISTSQVLCLLNYPTYQLIVPDYVTLSVGRMAKNGIPGCSPRPTGQI